MPDPSIWRITVKRYHGKTTKERFLEKVFKLEDIISPHVNTPCWLWTGKPGSFGYGHIHCDGILCMAHRLSWIINKGNIPKGLSVLHRCDIRNCIRPSHLFLGTYLDNFHDAVKKGRWKAGFGEAVGTSKLTAHLVQKIRYEYRDTKATQKQIGDKYGVTEECIKLIIDGKSWKRAGGPTGFKVDKKVRGERVKGAKLTDEKVKTIWINFHNGIKGYIIAKMLGVPRGSVYGVLSGKYWKHVAH